MAKCEALVLVFLLKVCDTHIHFDYRDNGGEYPKTRYFNKKLSDGRKKRREVF